MNVTRFGRSKRYCSASAAIAFLIGWVCAPFVSGVDLNVRTRVAVDLGWEPVAELRKEIHEGDPLVRGDWPWRWWGLEPFDEKRRDWEVRYSAFFRIESP